jgi:hypothetical protein
MPETWWTGSVELLTRGLGIRESGSPYLYISPNNFFLFGVIRACSAALFATELATILRGLCRRFAVNGMVRRRDSWVA